MNLYTNLFLFDELKSIHEITRDLVFEICVYFNIFILFMLQLPTQFYMALVRHNTKFLDLYYFDSCSRMIKPSFCNAAVYNNYCGPNWTDDIL